MEWPRVRLGDMLSLEYGKSLPAHARDPHGEFPVAGSNGPDGKHTSAFVSSPGIAVGRKGSAGKIYWYENDFWPIDTTYYVVPKLSLDMRWTYYLLSRLRLDRLATTTGVPGLNRNDAYSLEISLPPLSEQRRIVEILDQADRLRRRRADADAKAERILPALFIKMFGDPRTNPMDWRTAPLGDAIVETQYGTSKRANTDGQGVPVLRMNNISSSGEIDLAEVKFVDLDPAELERQLLQPGDILFNRTNSIELVGKTGLWTESEHPAVAASYLIRVRVDRDKVLPSYLWGLMNTPYIKTVLATKARRAVGMANINATELRRFPGMFPRIQCQWDFDTLLGSIRQANDYRHRSRIRIEQLFTHLLNRAFSGDLTASWREAHSKELLQEMERQPRALAGIAP